MAIKLIQINVEHDKHFDTVLPFLAAEQPDLVCIQELCEPNIGIYEKALGGTLHFSHMMIRDGIVEGVGVLSRLPMKAAGTEYYAGDGVMHEYDRTSNETKVMCQSYPISWADVVQEGTTYRFGSTHFIWTPDGGASDYQRTSVKKMLEVVEKLKTLVFCGDFNAPRGWEIYNTIAEKLYDHVPRTYTTSIDGDIHKAGPLDYRMVDGVFSTPDYTVSDVRMVCGVSDHCALVAAVAKSM